VRSDAGGLPGSKNALIAVIFLAFENPGFARFRETDVHHIVNGAGLQRLTPKRHIQRLYPCIPLNILRLKSFTCSFFCVRSHILHAPFTRLWFASHLRQAYF